MRVLNLNQLKREPIQIILNDLTYTLNIIPTNVFLPLIDKIDDISKGNFTPEVLELITGSVCDIFNLCAEGHKVDLDFIRNNVSLEMMLEIVNTILTDKQQLSEAQNTGKKSETSKSKVKRTKKTI